MSTFIAYTTSKCAVFRPEWTESDSKLRLSAKGKKANMLQERPWWKRCAEFFLL